MFYLTTYVESRSTIVLHTSTVNNIINKLHTSKDAACAYDCNANTEEEREAIFRKWETLSIYEINAAITTDQSINAFMFAPPSYRDAATAKIVQSVVSLTEIIGAYAFFWHMVPESSSTKWASEILLEKLGKQLNDITTAKVAYDEAVYRRYLDKNDALVQKIAYFIIAGATALIDLIDCHQQPLSHDHCKDQFNKKCYNFTLHEVRKAKTVKQLDYIGESFHNLPGVSKRIAMRVKEIGSCVLCQPKQNNHHKNHVLASTVSTTYTNLCEKALHCTIEPEEAINLLKISPKFGTAEQIAELTLHERLR